MVRLTILLFSLIATQAWGQAVTSVAGQVEQGAVLTVTGAGFGSKEAGPPVAWDSMETGAFSASWSDEGRLQIGRESRHAFSQYCATIDMGSSSAIPEGSGMAYFTGGSPSERWYAQYWFKLDEDFDWGAGRYGDTSDDLNNSNIKFFRMWNPSSAINENFHINLHGWGDNAQYYAENVSNAAGGYCESGYMTNWTKGVWHLLQFEYKDSSVGGNDGVFRMWRDGQLIVDDRDLMTREDYAEFKRPFILGFYDAWNDSHDDSDHFYMDDAYIDNTWARIEFGNAPTYDGCTIKEIQIPQTWSDTSIDFEVNLGSLAFEPSVYMFVVNHDGVVAPGIELALGEVPLPGIPGQPVRN